MLRRIFFVFSCLLTSCSLLLSLTDYRPLLQATVDGIVAIVNEDVITLTDIKIADAFGFYKNQSDDATESSYTHILERTIERKLIIALARQDLVVTPEEIATWLSEVSSNLQQGAMRRRLENFDITLEELGGYGEEVLLYQKILDQRFSLTVTASLSEIETYYTETYVPQKRTLGEAPAPMMQILEEIEAAVKADKSRSLISDWIQNLRKQAEILLFTERYPEYFKLLNY